MEINLADSMKNIVAKGIQTDVNSPYSGHGYITEKLYMLLQLYLQNKGWNPTLELLQCFNELKESSMLPSGAYLQMLASRVALDSQGRLVLRENGKIILPFEHFVNAIMLKHMNGPHGLHLSLEATVRAVIDSYTIGRDNFGMEKELILEVVQNCPNPTCRFYKSQVDINQSHSSKSEPSATSITTISITTPSSSNDNVSVSTSMAPPPQPPVSISLTPPSRPLSRSPSQPPSRPPSVDLTPTFESAGTNSSSSNSSCSNGNNKISPETPSPPPISAPLPPPSPKLPPAVIKPLTVRQQQQNKLADFLKANLENFDKVMSDPTMHDGSSFSDDGKRQDAGQEKIIRVFSEIMKNMGRMKSCVRPSMCKPYGKQSEALQKTVIDTIQLVQSLRSYLPPPHIAVSSWKNEDKHSRLERKTNSCSTLSSIANNANAGISGGVSLVSSGTMTASMVATPTSPVTITTAINTAMPSPANSSFTGNGNMVNVSTNATAEDLTDSSLRNKLSV